MDPEIAFAGIEADASGGAVRARIERTGMAFERRLLIGQGGKLTPYDCGDHRIDGVSQQDSQEGQR